MAIFVGLLIIRQKLSLERSVWKQGRSQQYHFTISYPQTWQQSEDGPLFSLVDTKSRAKEFRSYIRFGLPDSIKSKDDFDKIDQLSENTDISKFFASSDLTKRSVVKTRNLMVDGQNGFGVYEESLMPGPYFSDGVYILENDKVYYIHLTSSAKEELAREKPIFENILATFKFNS